MPRVMTSSPWPTRVGSLCLREAGAADIDHMLSFRNHPAVNRFMVHTSALAKTFRQDWLAVPTLRATATSPGVAELDGMVAAMGFLEVVDGSGQPGMPDRTEGEIGYIVDPAFAGRGVAS